MFVEGEKMNSNTKIFFEEYCFENFAEFIYDVQLDLQKHDKEYKKLINKRIKLLEKYPNVMEVLENGVQKSLTKQEASVVNRYIDLLDRCSIIFEKELFLRGMQETYFLLKRLNII